MAYYCRFWYVQIEISTIDMNGSHRVVQTTSKDEPYRPQVNRPPKAFVPTPDEVGHSTPSTRKLS